MGMERPRMPDDSTSYKYLIAPKSCLVVMTNESKDIVSCGTVRCPICDLPHDLKRTKNKGTPYFICSTCSRNSVVFLRSDWARERVREWSRDGTLGKRGAERSVMPTKKTASEGVVAGDTEDTSDSIARPFEELLERLRKRKSER